MLGTATNQAVLEIVEALVEGKAGAGLNLIQAALDAGSDPRQFARQMVDYLRALLLVRMGNAGQVDATPEMLAQMARHARGPWWQSCCAASGCLACHGGSKRQLATSPAAGDGPDRESKIQPKLSSCRGPEKVKQGAPRQVTETRRPHLQYARQRAAPAERPALKTRAHCLPSASQVSAVSRMFEENWRQFLAEVAGETPTLTGLLNSAKTHL